MSVVCESNGAVLTERDGRLICACPFACLATYERCEFAGPCGHEHQPTPYVPWWRRLAARIRLSLSGRHSAAGES